MVPVVETHVIMSGNFITGLNQGGQLYILLFLPQLSVPLIRSVFTSIPQPSFLPRLRI